eukprot:3167580-Lingulodinium_polyedra.AAC.1
MVAAVEAELDRACHVHPPSHKAHVWRQVVHLKGLDPLPCHDRRDGLLRVRPVILQRQHAQVPLGRRRGTE